MHLKNYNLIYTWYLFIYLFGGMDLVKVARDLVVYPIPYLHALTVWSLLWKKMQRGECFLYSIASWQVRIWGECTTYCWCQSCCTDTWNSSSLILNGVTVWIGNQVRDTVKLVFFLFCSAFWLWIVDKLPVQYYVPLPTLYHCSR
jgi:hypothetical protein